MIVTNVCLLLEALSIVICLHHLYGEKFRLDIATVSLLAIDMILMQAIDYLGLPGMVSILIYPVIAIYCGVEFGFKLKPIMLNIVLCVIIVGGMQWTIASSVSYFINLRYFMDFDLLATGILVLLAIKLILPAVKIERLSFFLQKGEMILRISIAICLLVFLFWIVNYKEVELIEITNTLVMFICMAFILILSMQLAKYKIKAKEIEIELRMHDLYSESFLGLIESIRLRQHEFNNHINTIYSQHYSCHTYEELVKVQRNYCELITKENRFSKLLSNGNPIIIGFLYGRFIEIEKLGIDISYKVHINELNVGIPIYKLIEVIGNLMNNAVEAMIADDKLNKLYVSIIETDRLYIEIRNESPYIEYDILSSFFYKGYSRKGENRGLGLYNVKKICEEYDMEISPECIELDGRNWLAFTIWKKIFEA